VKAVQYFVFLLLSAQTGWYCMNQNRSFNKLIVGCLAAILLLLSLKIAAQADDRKLFPADQFDSVAVLRLLKEGSSLTDKKPEEALQHFITAAEQSRILGFNTGLGLANAKIARWYFGNNSDKTIEYSRKALHYFEQENNRLAEDKADIHLLLAETFDEQGRQDSSAYYYYLLSNEIESGNISDAKLKIDLYTKLAIFWINLDYGNSEND